MDTKHLPFTLSSDSVSTQEVVSGSIILEDTVYTRSLTYLTTYAASQQKNPVSVTYSETGLFTLGNTNIYFQPQGGNALQFSWTPEGALTASSIAVSMGGHNYQFQIQ